MQVFSLKYGHNGSVMCVSATPSELLHLHALHLWGNLGATVLYLCAQARAHILSLITRVECVAAICYAEQHNDPTSTQLISFEFCLQVVWILRAFELGVPAQSCSHHAGLQRSRESREPGRTTEEKINCSDFPSKE